MNQKCHNSRVRSPGLTRREALQGVAAAALPMGFAGPAAAAVVGNNNPASWAMATDLNIYAQAFARRFTNALFNPLDRAAFGSVSAVFKPDPGTSNRYTITVAQGTQSVLGIPGVKTTIWGYSNHELGPTFPGRSFEVRQGAAIAVRWRNGLATAAGPLPHILPVDQTITLRTPSTGVPLAVHHHGGDTAFEFDGLPHQWQTPARKEVGPGILADNSLKQLALDIPALSDVYANAQEASLHWYHDHAESITRINIGAGLAGLYVVRDKNEDALMAANVIPSRAYEMALVLQDRTFDAAGNLAYAANPVDYPGTLSPTFPRNNPTHMPEKFGDVICVNGRAWPNAAVEPRCYRVRLLNGSDSRFYTLNFGAQTGVYQIGTDLGMLNRAVKLTSLTIAPGERVDLVLDFTAYAGQPTAKIDVTNSARTPFPNGVLPSGGTAVVMRFSVNLPKSRAPDPAAIALPLCSLRPVWGSLPATPALPQLVRRILLGEGVDTYGRITPLLGVYDPTGARNLGTLGMHDPITEKPLLGSTEVWEFWNATVDAHPLHMHLVQFRVVDRRAFTGTVAATVMANGWEGVKLQPGAQLTGAALPAPATERGWKDTVICPPGQVTRVVAQFNRAGSYVYHCHILSHEEHDMMRFYQVIDPAAHVLPDGLYTLQAVHSNKLLDISGASLADGGSAIQWSATGGKNQQWQLNALGNGEYSLKAVHSGKVLDVVGNSRNKGATVNQWSWWNGPNQRWRIEALGDDSYRIVSVNSGMVLDVSGNSTANGAKLQQWPWWGGACQRWRFNLVI